MDVLPNNEIPEKKNGEKDPIEGVGGLKTNTTTARLPKWLENFTHARMGESAIQVGTSFLTVTLVVGVAWLMQFLYHQANLGWTPGTASTSETNQAAISVAGILPALEPLDLNGISREAEMHTTIPSRPRIDVVKYVVQPGDTVFGIADKFGLKPTTILFGNYTTLKDSPDLLRPNQELNILPVDGTYYEYQGTETLTAVAQTFGAEVESIVSFPGNHLDPDAIDINHPSISAGTWLVIPGGRREFTSWTAPAQLVRKTTDAMHVWGQGACSGITVVQVGYGTFIYPTTEHWLSGTPFLPEIRHNGVDFAGSMGNPIYATDAGTVVYAGWNDWGYGNLVILDHGNGWQSLYGHLSQINVSCGQNVGQGDIIAAMGSTGHSTGPHLHFELLNATFGYVNPLDWMPQ